MGPVDENASGLTQADTDSLGTEKLPMVECDKSEYRLLATVVSPENPTMSFASISKSKDRTLYRIGDQVGDRTVLWISWRHLFLQGAKDICYVDMFSEHNMPKQKKLSKRKRARRRINRKRKALRAKLKRKRNKR